MRVCVNCGTEYDGECCPSCGSNRQETKSCPQCGAKVKGDARFCSDCGYPFCQNTEKKQEDINSQQPTEINQDTAASDGWFKKNLKIIVPVIVAVFLGLIIFIGYAIPTYWVNPANGTYYKLSEEGKPDRKSYLKLTAGKWTDGDGESGTYKNYGEKIILYYTLFGETEELEGTLKNYVITLNGEKYASEKHRHSYGDWEILSEATCGEEGIEAQICSCGARITRTIEKTSHTYDDELHFNDSEHWRVCTLCGEEAEKSFHINDTYCADCGYCGNFGLKYSLNSDKLGYTVKAMSDISYKNVVIPETYNGLPVTAIGEYAFYSCSTLSSIKIPDSVTSIGKYAFYNCGALKSISTPEYLSSIGGYAFYNCRSLSVIEIPDFVTSLDEYTFYNCASISNLVIPDSVVWLGDYVFYGCSTLTSVTIGNGLTSIGNGVFYYCDLLENLTVASGNTKYRSAGNCVIETESKTLVLGSKNSVIPNDGSVTSISRYAFYGCRTLESINIPDGVTTISEDAFYNCSSLKSITMPDSLLLIGANAFYDCSMLTNVTMGNRVTAIGRCAFYNCSSLKSITMPDSIFTIGDYSFNNCRSLESINIPSRLTSIGEFTFYGCFSLKSITIPDGVTSIGKYAFNGCSSLENVIIPDGVTVIGDHIFCNCISLKSITIPKDVMSIEEYALWRCSSLENIVYKGTTEQWQAITKGVSWSSYAGEFTVICSDGNLDKNGNKI